MKFFTRGWTHGDMTDEESEAVVPAYWRHVEALALPPSVDALAKLNTHDAYVLAVEHDVSAGTLQLRLRCGDLQVGYFDALVRFAGVSLHPEHFDMLSGARRPADFEILDDEVDRSGDGIFEYRLLLSPVFEVRFEFKQVDVSKRSVAGRDAP